MDTVGNSLATLLVALAVLTIIFLICREIVCWYWKINQSIALLTEIRDLLAQRNVTSSTGGTLARPGATVPD
jgi:hypothetical protein